MKKIAFLFPGQGSQYVGMAKDFFDSFAIAKQTFEEADDLLKVKLSDIIFNGPEDKLTLTKNSQPAIFVMSAAILRVLQSLSPIKPDICAGLSLGEYSALFACNYLFFKEALFLVQKRALLMHEACEKNKGTMAAVLGLGAKEIEEALSSLNNVWIANYNTPGQIVISGTLEGVETGSKVLKEKGAKRVIPLQVHGAFHSGLMKEAEKELSEAILNANFQTPSSKLIMNVTGGFVSEISQIKNFLIKQLTNSVKWYSGVEAMQSYEIEHYLEIGCGKALCGMNKKMQISGSCVSIEKVNELTEYLKGEENGSQG